MTKEKNTGFKKYVRWFWGIIIGGFASVLLLFLLAAWGVFGDLPTFEELENPQNNLATEIISSKLSIPFISPLLRIACNMETEYSPEVGKTTFSL